MLPLSLFQIPVSVYWWDPFVWAAAYASRGDGEFSCDEVVIRTLGEDERYDYGRALIGMIAGNAGTTLFPPRPQCTAAQNI